MTTRKNQQTKPDSLEREISRWEARKMFNESSVNAMDFVDKKKAARMDSCGSVLAFSAETNKLQRANFCKVRLCPMCQWRKSLKTFGQMSQIINHLNAQRRYRYLFVTLTVRNCKGAELSKTLDEMLHAWNKLRKYPELNPDRKGCYVRGWYRSVEVTHNVDPNSPSYDTYHPHIHAILAVLPAYFGSDTYISHKRLVAMWKQAARLDYDPDVFIKTIKETDPQKLTKAIAEVSKYAVKSSDFIIPNDWDLTVETVRLLNAALHRRRFISYGGAMRKAHDELHLDDVENGDLVHVEEQEKITEEEALVWYVWNSGYRQYVREP